MTIRDLMMRDASTPVMMAALLLFMSGRLQRPQQRAAHPFILVGQPILVSRDAPNVNHAEPWLAVSPLDPARAVVGAIVDRGGTQSVVYSTLDGGRAWRRGVHGGSEPQLFPGLDPVTVFDTDGISYLSTITPFRVWRSQDGGASWQGPAEVPGRSFDREYLAIRATPGGADTIYALAKTPIQVFGHLANDVLALSRSTDGGRTFEAPRLMLPDPTTSITHVPGGLVVAPSGLIVFSFLAHDVPVANPALLKNRIWIARSTNGGRTFDLPVAAGATVIHGNRGNEVDMLKSLATVGIAIDTAPGSPHRGRLYVAYLTVHDGRLQVMVTASSDTGRTWTQPVRVNDDDGRSNHSNPRLAVNDQGTLAVLWNDRRTDPGDLCFRATVSASTDGGRTFLPNVALTPGTTCPLGRNAAPPSASGFNRRFLQGGETQGLAPLPGGKFLTVFVGGADEMQLYSATVEVTRRPTSR